MDERTVTLLLRLIHILAGIFWVGAIFLIAGFLLPTAGAAGREGGRFMQHLMLQRRLAYGAGGIAAILGALVGGLVSGRAARRMAEIGQRAAQKGGPSAEEQAEMERLQRRMALGSGLVAGVLGFSAGTMAVARYL